MGQKTALERIDDLEKRSQQNEANSSGATAMAEAGLHKLVALEQSYAALAKTVYGLISYLKDKGMIEDKAVMAAIRKLDEQNNKREVESLEASGKLLPTEEVLGNGLVIARTVLTESNSAETTVLSEYNVLDLSNQNTSSDLRSGLTNKKAGEWVDLPVEGETITHTVLKSYKFAE